METKNNLDVGPPESLDLVPLNRVLEPHVVPDAVGMREGLGTRGHRAGGRVPRVVLVQVVPHFRDVLEDPGAQRTPEGLLLLLLLDLDRMPVVQSVVVVLVGRLLLLLVVVVVGRLRPLIEPRRVICNHHHTNGYTPPASNFIGFYNLKGGWGRGMGRAR